MTTTARRARVVSGALVLILAVAIGAGFAWRRLHRDPIADLAQVVGTRHDVAGRLSGGFAPRAETVVRRGGAAGEGERLSPDARIAIARIEKAAGADRRPAMIEALGVAFLVEGEVDRAIAALDEAASTSDDARAWSDLSAAYLTKAERARERRVEYLARALDAAARSLRGRPTNDARFNRALALAQLAPYVGGGQPWDEYLRSDRDSPWTAEARRHAAAPAATFDARASWDERRAVLKTKLDEHDRLFVVETAKRFPEAAQEFFEQDLVLGWARATLAGDAAAAARLRGLAADLADAWKDATHDPMLIDVAARIAAIGARRDAALALARAHVDYADAARKYRIDDYAGATASVDRALAGLVRANTPFWAWAALLKATILFQHRDLDESDAGLAPIEAFAREHAYATLLGRTLRQRGLTQSKQWRITEALASFEESVHVFDTAGEHEASGDNDRLLAANLRMLGEHHRSWEFIGGTLERLGRQRTPLRRYLVLYNASLFASSQELYETAFVFQDAAVRQARVDGGGPLAEALVNRAAILNKRDDGDDAERDVREAMAILPAVPDAPPKRYIQADIGALRALLPSARGDRARLDGLRGAIDFFAKADPARVPRLYLDLAAACRRERDVRAEERALSDGIASLEAQDRSLGDEALRISYFDEAWNVFPEMVALQLDAHRDPVAAFDFAERARARSLATGTRPVRLSELQQRIPRASAVIYYVTLADRVLAWTITGSRVDFAETRIGDVALRRTIGRYVSLLEDERDIQAARETGLYDALVRPIRHLVDGVETLVFIGDGDLQRVPFAALQDPASGRFLIETHAVLTSPSATVFAGAVARPHDSGPVASALLVGNPAIDAAASGLRPLPGSEREVVAAARFYARRTVLTGREATRNRFLESAGDYDVVHFGGHAVANPEYPLMSRLFFAMDHDGAPPELLFAHEISRLTFSRTRVVVLAACSTAAGAVSRGEGVVSLARPFLAAGVPMVVASQWDVDDRATARLFLEFHRDLARTADPVESLRAAQLSLLRSGDAALASPHSWGAFVVIGAYAR